MSNSNFCTYSSDCYYGQICCSSFCTTSSSVFCNSDSVNSAFQLGVGIIIAIVVGCLLACAGCIGLCVFLCVRSRNARPVATQGKVITTTTTTAAPGGYPTSGQSYPMQYQPQAQPPPPGGAYPVKNPDVQYQAVPTSGAPYPAQPYHPPPLSGAQYPAQPYQPPPAGVDTPPSYNMQAQPNAPEQPAYYPTTAAPPYDVATGTEYKAPPPV